MHLNDIVTASVDFPAEMTASNSTQRLAAWPKFIMFPEDALLRGRRALVVDDVWGSGRTITAVKSRISGAAGIPYTCVLHFNPYRSLFGSVRPDYYAEVTDAHIVYPWEINRTGWSNKAPPGKLCRRSTYFPSFSHRLTIGK
jgi:hypoxanthine phosphoribosyltransferase